MAEISVNTAMTDIASSKINQVSSISRINTDYDSGNFESIMDKTSKKSFEVNKKETKKSDSPIETEMEKNSQINKKIKDSKVNEEPTESVEDIKAVVESVVNELKEKIADELNISVSELEEFMQEMSIEDYQLFDADVLKEIVIGINGLEGAQELLFDENALSDFKNIIKMMESCEEKLEANGVSILENGFEIADSGEDVLPDKVEENDTTETKNVESDDAETEETVIEKTQMSKEESSELNNEGEKSEDDLNYGRTDAGKNVSLTNANPIENIEKILETKVGKMISESILSQISEKIRLNLGGEFKSMEMQLYPEHLGKVSIEVVVREGTMTAKIYAENEAVKNILESQLASLKESFNEQGLKVEDVEVTVASRSFEENNMSDGENRADENKGKNKKTNLSFFEELDGEDEKIQEEIMEIMGNTVSYTA